mmetsp:Transcript_3674/g.7629  ORF Transcript_3674/g.7629 Transcript_3674/m.7629 type:complete len:331 (+) Transcript_3674:368-1360(+)
MWNHIRYSAEPTQYLFRLHTAVGNLHDENVRGTNVVQVVHLFGRLLLGDEAAHRLVAVEQRLDGGAVLPGRNDTRRVKELRVHVVGYHDEAGGGDVPVDAAHEEGNLVRIGSGLGVGDEHGLAGHDFRDDFQSGGPHGRAGLDQVHHGIREPQPARRFHAPAHELDLGLRGASTVEPAEVTARNVREARHNPSPRHLRRGLYPLRRLRLQAQPAPSEPEFYLRRHFHAALPHHVLARDSQRHVSLPDVRRDVRGGEEHQGQLQVVAVGHVQTGQPGVLDAGAGQQRGTFFVETALLRDGDAHVALRTGVGGGLLGHAGFGGHRGHRGRKK